jgi:hypothetical protein
MKEEDYINKKVIEYNAQEKGKGEKWLSAWKGDRTRVYQPKFELLLNEHLGSKLKASSTLSEATYVLVVKTKLIEPGFNAGWPIKKNAYTNIVYEFYETNRRDAPVSRLVCNNIPGRMAGGFDFDASLRISEGYGNAGKILGKYLFKIL